jgi:DNA-directed RNA polymerase specialized sigma24 family protein
MQLLEMLEELRLRHRYVRPTHIREAFGDYHNALYWLAFFLLEDEKLAEACVIDVCTIATTASPGFHEWLVYWAVRATFRSAFQQERTWIANLASEYEKDGPLREEQRPLLVKQFRDLVRDSEQVHSRLDVLCRFVLVMRGIAKDSFDTIASELRVSRAAVQQAYCVALQKLELKCNKESESPFVPALG